MKERGLPYQPAMVLATLRGDKTATRRVVKLPKMRGRWESTSVGGPATFHLANGRAIESPKEVAIWNKDTGHCIGCPYGQIGDRLYVREAWRTSKTFDDVSWKQMEASALEAGYEKAWGPIQYEADGKRLNFQLMDVVDREVGRYRHGRFMPRWASRILLEIVGIRVERLQDMEEEDALAEGVFEVKVEGYPTVYTPYPVAFDEVVEMRVKTYETAVGAFKQIWSDVNGPDAWDENPFVWVVEFKPVEIKK